jgi:hypothetical protein
MMGKGQPWADSYVEVVCVAVHSTWCKHGCCTCCARVALSDHWVLDSRPMLGMWIDVALGPLGYASVWSSSHTLHFRQCLCMWQLHAQLSPAVT